MERKPENFMKGHLYIRKETCILERIPVNYMKGNLYIRKAHSKLYKKHQVNYIKENLHTK